MVDLKDAIEVAVGNLRFLDRQDSVDPIARLIEAMRLLPDNPIAAHRRVSLAYTAIIRCAYAADDAGDVDSWVELHCVASDVRIIGERLAG